MVIQEEPVTMENGSNYLLLLNNDNTTHKVFPSGQEHPTLDLANWTILFNASNYTEPGYNNLLSDVVGVWLTGVFCLLGLAGNILSFIVLLQAHGHSPMFFVLRAVAISDTLFLLCVFLIQTAVNMYNTTGFCEWCHMHRGYIQFVLWPVMLMSQMTTVWLTVLVSVERYIAVCWPLKSMALCTMSNVKRSVTFIYVFAAIYNIPRYFEFEVTGGIASYLKKSSVGNNEIYRYVYTSVSYSLMLFFIPLLMLVFLNARLVLALRHGKKQWATLQFRQKKEQNLTVIPLAIVLIFFVCGTPALVYNVIEAMKPSIQNVETFVIFLVTANLLVVLNSACNFIIYCMLGKKFRQKLSEMCHCKCGKYRVVSTSNNHTTMANNSLYR